MIINIALLRMLGILLSALLHKSNFICELATLLQSQIRAHLYYNYVYTKLPNMLILILCIDNNVYTCTKLTNLKPKWKGFTVSLHSNVWLN